MFRHDSDANLNVHALDEEEMEESCDELDNNEDSDEEVNVIISKRFFPYTILRIRELLLSH